jgi:hypothetical protein
VTSRRSLLERLATLAAEQAAVLGQLAALEDGPSAPAAPTSRPRRKRARTLYAAQPGVEVDPMAAAQARKALNRYGR